MYKLKTERQLFKANYKYLAGIDEAGRGPLAGPVVAACVGLSPEVRLKNPKLKEVNDSKKLSAKKREYLFEIISEEFTDIGIGVVGNEQIDQLNILQANFLAMRQALKKLTKMPDLVLVDGNLRIPKIIIEQRPIIKGDSQVFLIAAASIIAKTTRDRLMLEYDQLYPKYGFAQHKGYGTKLHLTRLEQYGASPIHRQSFAPVRLYQR